MNTSIPSPIFLAVDLAVITILLSAAVSAAEDPTPSPTPRPRTLAAYAGSIKLKTSDGNDATGQIIISSDTLADLADQAVVTIGGSTVPRSGRQPSGKEPTASERARWRKKYLAQKEVVMNLEKKRLRIEAEIDLLEDGRLTTRVLARVQRAEIEVRALERDLQRERSELWRIVREARRHGAEPGWFR